MFKLVKLVFAVVSFFIAAQAYASTHSLVQGWNLEGNNNGSAIDPVAVFGNATTPTGISPSVTTVWVWDKTLGQWDFFAPSMTSAALTTYAASKGYGVLTNIQDGEGFWVNVNAASGVSVNLSVPPALSIFAGNISSAGSVDNTGANALFHFTNPVTSAGPVPNEGGFGIGNDGAGNIYVADTGNNTIRKISSAGVVTTIAGTPGVIGSADNNNGLLATFNKPYGVASDSSGNLYVADSYNHTIRKISPTGVVTTLAGSPGVIGQTDAIGSAARFQYPTSLTIDSTATNLYVADSSNTDIRQVRISDGNVTTIAGTPTIHGSRDGTGSVGSGAAQFNYPFAIAADGLGNLYVTDTYNHTIRKIVISSGAVTTIAGTVGVAGSSDGIGSAAKFNYPMSIATDNTGNIYVADSGNSTIRKIVASTGQVSTLAGVAGTPGFTAGGLPGLLTNPGGVGVKGSTLYIITGNAVVELTNLP